MSDSKLRAHARFVHPVQVLVSPEDRDELRVLWARDISQGGIFVETARPPPMRTAVQVSIVTPDGVVELTAEVVHILDAETASASGMPPGVGLQFTDLTDETRSAVEDYLAGVAETIRTPVRGAGRARSTEDVVGAAQRLFDCVEADDLYGAIDIAPLATPEEIAARIESLRALFQTPGSELTPAVHARVQHAVGRLRRIQALLEHPERRLAYDFTHGHVLAEARLQPGEGEDEAAFEDRVKMLRAAWHTHHPGHFSDAERLALQAAEAEDNGDYVAARVAAAEALEFDPFNLELRGAIERWDNFERGLAEAEEGLADDTVVT